MRLAFAQRGSEHPAMNADRVLSTNNNSQLLRQAVEDSPVQRRGW